MAKPSTNGQITHLGDLRPDPANRRRHTPRNIGAIVDSLHEVGAARSIVIDEDGVILAGNGVADAAAEAGIERVQVVDADGETIIAVRRTGLTDAQKRRLALFDNRAAELAEWDTDRLLADLNAGLNFDGLWDKSELDALLAGVMQTSGLVPGVDPDTVPPSAPARCQRGEVWELGNHRLMCGDSTCAEDVARLMGGERAALVCSDPPYNIGCEYDGYEDAKPREEYESIARDWFDSMMLHSVPAIVTPGRQNIALWAGFPGCHVGCWIKSNAHGGASISHFAKWEPICFYGKHKRERDCDVFEHHVDNGFLNDESASGHACPKPVRLIVDLLENYSAEGDVVCDHFGGSGTLLIAAELAARSARLIEQSPRYCDIALLRWETATGQQARRVE